MTAMGSIHWVLWYIFVKEIWNALHSQRDGATSVGYKVKYFLTDHLGSVRVVEDAYGTVEETNDYYPFGSRWVDSESAVSTNRCRFAGKEEQRTYESVLLLCG